MVLSGETAVGEYPIAAVQRMHTVQTEKVLEEGAKHTWNSEAGCLSVTESVAQAVCRIAGLKLFFIRLLPGVQLN